MLPEPYEERPLDAGVVRAGLGYVGDVGAVRASRVARDAALLSMASMPRQMVMGAAGVPPSASISSTLLVNKRPPPPLELMAEEVQIGVRGATTTVFTSKTSPPPHALPQLLTPPYHPPVP